MKLRLWKLRVMFTINRTLPIVVPAMIAIGLASIHPNGCALSNTWSSCDR